MELRFDAMLYSILGNKNSYAAHIKCSRGPQVPQPDVKRSRIDRPSTSEIAYSHSKGVRTSFLLLGKLQEQKHLIQRERPEVVKITWIMYGDVVH